jgi:acetylornithine deacetylase/succinyl-diaminopimelate desuccinylase-like protein
VLDGLKRFVADRLPADARVQYEVFGLAPAIEVPTDSAWVRGARATLAEEFGRDPVMMGCGGSIPVVDSLRRILGMDSLLVGFGLEDDRPHSPGEKFELRCFQRGIRSHIRMLAKLAGL